MSRYDKDIDENPYLTEHGKYAIQFARNHGITVKKCARILSIEHINRNNMQEIY